MGVLHRKYFMIEIDLSCDADQRKEKNQENGPLLEEGPIEVNSCFHVS